MRQFFFRILCGCTLLTAVTPAQASFLDTLKEDITKTYHSEQKSLMIPVLAWHNRLTYDNAHIDKYNETPWGLGAALSYYEDENWHGLYAMAFKDSNSYMETFFGYAYLKNTALDNEKNWHLGYGYTLGITQRHEYAYIPIPLPLPIAAVSYKKASINAAYVPGLKNDGNVLFCWLRYDL
ncbi:MAG: lipid IV(A) palmitoyltransferase PagP [Alphaproteobacteria bacterium]|nr:lipid IV(A) palmitoyltransferase PagP [Alphaproteobacteria bacterium]